MLQLILPPTENVLPGNKERRTNEKNRITPPWRKYLEQRQPFYRMDRCRLGGAAVYAATQDHRQIRRTVHRLSRGAEKALIDFDRMVESYTK